MSAEIITFNPLDKKNLGASVAEAMLSRKAYPLAEVPQFKGAGIYAIYYSGSFAPYAELASRNQEGILSAPIYVGKAIHSGARKGGGAASGTANGRPLYNRLAEHAESIRVVANLAIEDFQCRFLVVDDIWIPLGESLLIARFTPIWNALIDGFGNHDPGSGRYNGMRPRWDVLHPGREWAPKCRDRVETAKDIEADVQAFLASMTFPKSERFIEADE